ncbi:MAG: hypothetical protein QOE86_3950 [Solirubrobacteraceae bacterium]|jgi:hypothetical protein|nr:hypothetical protein [Solirubrobacteraceae bacterium]
MADHLLFMSWSNPVRGLEERAVEVFNDALGILGRRQQQGKIEGFDVALMEPNGELGGYIAARGTAEQITALRTDEEFMRNTIDAQLCVEDIRHIEGVTNEAISEQMGMYTEAVGRIPSRA